jgi:hypothetical protein
MQILLKYFHSVRNNNIGAMQKLPFGFVLEMITNDLLEIGM